MGGTIVCGIEGSADSRAAVNVAAQFADRLILANVAELAHVPYAAAGGDQGK
jgi:hypothetical protein